MDTNSNIPVQKKVVKIELPNLQNTGFGWDGSFTRTEWRKLCADNFLAGKNQFLVWQESWKDSIKSDLPEVSLEAQLTYDDDSIESNFGRLYETVKPYTLDFVGYSFETNVDAEDFTFLQTANFSNAKFAGNANFSRATFTGNANFSNATFTRNAYFNNAMFTRIANFSKVSYVENAYFSSAMFTMDVYFTSATFTALADWIYATFTGDADFSNATFTLHTYFNRAIFTGSAYFFSATFTGSAYFFSAIFKWDLNFHGATFTGDLNFQSASFSESLNFHGATFTGDLNFRRATFTGDLIFSRATFTEDADFHCSTFKGDADFDNATFIGNADFNNATFTGNSNFSGVEFKGNAIFAGATFTRKADFYKIKFINQCRFDYDPEWEENGKEWGRETWFLGAANFENAQIDNVGHFENVRFNGEIPNFLGVDNAKTLLIFSEDSYFNKLDISKDSVKRLGQLKRLADEQGQTDQALMFNAFELNAKGKLPDASVALIITTRLYESISDYGRSFTKPLKGYLALLLMTFTFALGHAMYLTERGCDGKDWWLFTNLWHEDIKCEIKPAKEGETPIRLTAWRASVEYTSYRASGILDFADSDKQTIAVANRLFDQPIEPPWMRAWGVFKAIASAALLFLAALGLRNKYRIK